jgi:pimeloyl-ACP methyl ester carboxylesterase
MPDKRELHRSVAEMQKRLSLGCDKLFLLLKKMGEKPFPYENFCASLATTNQQYLTTTDGVSLNVITFTPPGEKVLNAGKSSSGVSNRDLPIVFLPGLASVIDNFRETLKALTESHIVYYIETREKSSSRITGKVGYSISEIAGDLPVVIEKLGLAAGGYIICGYSLGAAVAVSAFRLIGNKPSSMILIEPSATFLWPGWLLPLARYGKGAYPLIKPFIKWYMKRFRINCEEDYEMYEINARILDQADHRKLAATVIAVADFEIWEELKSVDSPTLVIGVSDDKFHSHDEASKIAAGIPDSSYYDIRTNRRSHSAEVAKIVDSFLLPGSTDNFEVPASPVNENVY